jgi:hypothetical protein
VITMIPYPQPAFDQGSNSLGGPQFRPVAVGHGTLRQELDQLCFLFFGQSRWSSGGWLGFQRVRSTRVQRVAPAKHRAGVASNPTGDLMEREFLLQQSDDATTTLLQRFRSTLRSHMGTSIRDAPIVLHYLCGSQ